MKQIIVRNYIKRIIINEKWADYLVLHQSTSKVNTIDISCYKVFNPDSGHFSAVKNCSGTKEHN